MPCATVHHRGTASPGRSLLPVERVQHLNDNESRQSHGRGFRAGEDVAVDALKAFVLHEALRLVGLVVVVVVVVV